VLADPQLVARDMVQQTAHATAGPISVLGLPVKLSATPGRIRTAPPTLGQDTVAVLQEIGMSGDEIEMLRKVKAI
jgi:crotonobetainyl-CoA:carnitine CoA-transferase CaiB-like acyl-CoA transferase